MIGTMILIFISWNMFGGLILGTIAACTPLGNVHGLPCFNPIWLYRNYKLNWVGAFLCALGLNLCCPIATIGYWFYKLCTVGRR